MEKQDNKIPCENCPHNQNPNCNEVEKAKEKNDISTKIYNFLNFAEKIAVKLAQVNAIRKKQAKKKKKKFKKLGKVDKKTGTLILKKEKVQKTQKPMKRYKAPKKK